MHADKSVAALTFLYLLKLKLIIYLVLLSYMLRPSKDGTRKELDKLLHTDDVISMRLLCIEFDSELLFAAACSIWLRSVTRLKYVIDPSLFSH